MQCRPSQVRSTQPKHQLKSGHKLESLLDITRAAKLLGISPKTLAITFFTAVLITLKLGGRVLFRPDRLWDFIERNTIHARQ